MRIQEGTSAPMFQANDIFGDLIDLSGYAGRIVLLSFFRNAACAICNLRVHELIKRYPAYQRAGLTVVAVFESPRERMLEHVAKQDAPFPLIADPQAHLYDLYGVEISESKVAATMAMPETEETVKNAAAYGFPLIQEPNSNFNRMPADFLIGSDGCISSWGRSNSSGVE
jgi:peroxiredoxin